MWHADGVSNASLISVTLNIVFWFSMRRVGRFSCTKLQVPECSGPCLSTKRSCFTPLFKLARHILPLYSHYDLVVTTSPRATQSQWNRSRPAKRPSATKWWSRLTSMQIKIKTLTGKVSDFNVEADETVLDLKRSLEAKEGIDQKQIKLIFK